MIIATPVVFEKLRFQNVFNSVHTNIKRTASVFPPIWRAFSSVDVRPNRWNKDAFSNCFLPIVDGKLLRFQNVDGALHRNVHVVVAYLCIRWTAPKLQFLLFLLCFLQAWTAVQVFDEGYVVNGCYQLPLYTGDPPEVLSSCEVYMGHWPSSGWVKMAVYGSRQSRER